MLKFGDDSDKNACKNYKSQLEAVQKTFSQSLCISTVTFLLEWIQFYKKIWTSIWTSE